MLLYHQPLSSRQYALGRKRFKFRYDRVDHLYQLGLPLNQSLILIVCASDCSVSLNIISFAQLLFRNSLLEGAFLCQCPNYFITQGSE
jgi:hypothetical protein